jgi:hypothetical protein
MAKRNTLKEDVVILLDREAIKELRVKYCLCLDTKNMDGLKELFHRDIVLQFGDQEVQKGVEKAITFLEGKFKIYKFLVHFIHNQIIEINGNEAKGTCYLESYLEKDGEELICTGYYDDRFIKKNGQWLFSSRKFNVFYFVPLKEGWAGKEKGSIKAVLESKI